MALLNIQPATKVKFTSTGRMRVVASGGYGGYGGGGGGGGLSSGLQAFYRLSDTSDSSGNGNTLTNNGGVTFSSGKIGNCASIDGNFLTKSPWNIGQTFSTSFWLNVTSLSDYEFLVIQFQGMCIYTKSDGSIEFGDGASWSSVTPGNTIQANTWHHCVLVSDNGYGTLYVDGVNQASNNSNQLNLNDSGDRLFGLGGDGESGGNNVVKQIDAVGIWNRTLTSGEISDLYDTGAGIEL